MGGVERNKFCTDGRMAFWGEGKKNCGGSRRGHFFRASLSGRTSAAAALPSTATRTALQRVAASGRAPFKGRASLTGPGSRSFRRQEMRANFFFSLLFFFLGHCAALPTATASVRPVWRHLDVTLSAKRLLVPGSPRSQTPAEATRQCEFATCLFLASPRHPGNTTQSTPYRRLHMHTLHPLHTARHRFL